MKFDFYSQWHQQIIQNLLQNFSGHLYVPMRENGTQHTATPQQGSQLDLSHPSKPFRSLKLNATGLKRKTIVVSSGLIKSDIVAFQLLSMFEWCGFRIKFFTGNVETTLSHNNFLTHLRPAKAPKVIKTFNDSLHSLDDFLLLTDEMAASFIAYLEGPMNISEFFGTAFLETPNAISTMLPLPLKSTFERIYIDANAQATTHNELLGASDISCSTHFHVTHLRANQGYGTCNGLPVDTSASGRPFTLTINAPNLLHSEEKSAVSAPLFTLITGKKHWIKIAFPRSYYLFNYDPYLVTLEISNSAILQGVHLTTATARQVIVKNCPELTDLSWAETTVTVDPPQATVSEREHLAAPEQLTWKLSSLVIDHCNNLSRLPIRLLRQLAKLTIKTQTNRTSPFSSMLNFPSKAPYSFVSLTLEGYKGSLAFLDDCPALETLELINCKVTRWCTNPLNLKNALKISQCTFDDKPTINLALIPATLHLDLEDVNLAFTLDNKNAIKFQPADRHVALALGRSVVVNNLRLFLDGVFERAQKFHDYERLSYEERFATSRDGQTPALPVYKCTYHFSETRQASNSAHYQSNNSSHPDLWHQSLATLTLTLHSNDLAQLNQLPGKTYLKTLSLTVIDEENPRHSSPCIKLEGFSALEHLTIVSRVSSTKPLKNSLSPREDQGVTVDLNPKELPVLRHLELEKTVPNVDTFELSQHRHLASLRLRNVACNVRCTTHPTLTSIIVDNASLAQRVTFQVDSHSLSLTHLVLTNLHFIRTPHALNNHNPYNTLQHCELDNIELDQAAFDELSQSETLLMLSIKELSGISQDLDIKSNSLKTLKIGTNTPLQTLSLSTPNLLILEASSPVGHIEIPQILALQQLRCPPGYDKQALMKDLINKLIAENLRQLHLTATSLEEQHAWYDWLAFCTSLNALTLPYVDAPTTLANLPVLASLTFEDGSLPPRFNTLDLNKLDKTMPSLRTIYNMNLGNSVQTIGQHPFLESHQGNLAPLKAEAEMFIRADNPSQNTTQSVFFYGQPTPTANLFGACYSTLRFNAEHGKFFLAQPIPPEQRGLCVPKSYPLLNALPFEEFQHRCHSNYGINTLPLPSGYLTPVMTPSREWRVKAFSFLRVDENGQQHPYRGPEADPDYNVSVVWNDILRAQQFLNNHPSPSSVIVYYTLVRVSPEQKRQLTSIPQPAAIPPAPPAFPAAAPQQHGAAPLPPGLVAAPVARPNLSPLDDGPLPSQPRILVYHGEGLPQQLAADAKLYFNDFELFIARFFLIASQKPEVFRDFKGNALLRNIKAFTDETCPADQTDAMAILTSLINLSEEHKIRYVRDVLLYCCDFNPISDGSGKPTSEAQATLQEKLDQLFRDTLLEELKTTPLQSDTFQFKQALEMLFKSFLLQKGQNRVATTVAFILLKAANISCVIDNRGVELVLRLENFHFDPKLGVVSYNSSQEDVVCVSPSSTIVCERYYDHNTPQLMLAPVQDVEIAVDDAGDFSDNVVSDTPLSEQATLHVATETQEEEEDDDDQEDDDVEKTTSAHPLAKYQALIDHSAMVPYDSIENCFKTAIGEAVNRLIYIRANQTHRLEYAVCCKTANDKAATKSEFFYIHHAEDFATYFYKIENGEPQLGGPLYDLLRGNNPVVLLVNWANFLDDIVTYKSILECDKPTLFGEDILCPLNVLGLISPVTPAGEVFNSRHSVGNPYSLIEAPLPREELLTQQAANEATTTPFQLYGSSEWTDKLLSAPNFDRKKGMTIKTSTFITALKEKELIVLHEPPLYNPAFRSFLFNANTLGFIRDSDGPIHHCHKPLVLLAPSPQKQNEPPISLINWQTFYNHKDDLVLVNRGNITSMTKMLACVDKEGYFFTADATTTTLPANARVVFTSDIPKDTLRLFFDALGNTTLSFYHTSQLYYQDGAIMRNLLMVSQAVAGSTVNAPWIVCDDTSTMLHYIRERCSTTNVRNGTVHNPQPPIAIFVTPDTSLSDLLYELEEIVFLRRYSFKENPLLSLLSAGANILLAGDLSLELQYNLEPLFIQQKVPLPNSPEPTKFKGHMQVVSTKLSYLTTLAPIKAPVLLSEQESSLTRPPYSNFQSYLEALLLVKDGCFSLTQWLKEKAPSDKTLCLTIDDLEKHWASLLPLFIRDCPTPLFYEGDLVALNDYPRLVIVGDLSRLPLTKKNIIEPFIKKRPNSDARIHQELCAHMKKQYAGADEIVTPCIDRFMKLRAFAITHRLRQPELSDLDSIIAELRIASMNQQRRNPNADALSNTPAMIDESLLNLAMRRVLSPHFLGQVTLEQKFWAANGLALDAAIALPAKHYDFGDEHIVTPCRRPLLDDIDACLAWRHAPNAKKGVLLQGPSAIGKTTLLLHYLKARGFKQHTDYVFISAGQDDTIEQVIKAYKNGKIILIDELNYDQDLMRLLTQLMSDDPRENPYADDSQKPGGFVFATQNPSSYQGCKSWPPTLPSHFHMINVPDYDKTSLEYICHKRGLNEDDIDPFITAYETRREDPEKHINARVFFRALASLLKQQASAKDTSSAAAEVLSKARTSSPETTRLGFFSPPSPAAQTAKGSATKETTQGSAPQPPPPTGSVTGLHH